MAKVQTRRSVSVSGPIYAKLKKHCDRLKVSVSSEVEKALGLLLEQKEAQVQLAKIVESVPTVLKKDYTISPRAREFIARDKLPTGNKAVAVDPDTENNRKVVADRIFTF